jgi:hypothetical protein
MARATVARAGFRFLFLFARQLVMAQDAEELISLFRANFRAEMDARDLQQQAMIDQQHAVIRELQSRLVDTGTRVTTLQVTAIQNHRDADSWRSRRALSSTQCANISGPQLLVHGVCSCTDDVIIGDRSLKTELDDLAETVADLEALVRSRTATTAGS